MGIRNFNLGRSHIWMKGKICLYQS